MKTKRKAELIILEIVMILCSLIILIPLLIVLLGSVKDSLEAAGFNISLPTEWHFENFAFVVENGNIIQSFLNSVLITAASTVIGVLSSAMLGFVLARRNTRGTEQLYNYIFLGMVAPMQIITTFFVLSTLQLSGSYIGVILVYIAINLPFNTFLFTSFIKGVPRELDEAAIMDGCGIWRMFFSVILPLLKPVVATSGIIFAMNVWNDFQLPLYFLSDSSKWTLPLTVYSFYGKYFSSWNYVFADMIITALPLLIIYMFAQKYIVQGMTAGAVKG